MLINYLVLVASIAVPALIWRALLLDHPALLSWVKKLPLVGGSAYLWILYRHVVFSYRGAILQSDSGSVW